MKVKLYTLCSRNRQSQSETVIRMNKEFLFHPYTSSLYKGKSKNGIHIFFTFCFLLFAFCTAAQRYAVVDVQYIKSQWPEYHKADTTVKLEAFKWEKIVDSAKLYADSLAHRFDAEQYMLNDELKQKRKIEVDNANKRVIYLNTHYFGYQGELFKERERLIQPLQNKLYNTIQRMALSSGWDYVLDKSAGTGLLYSDPKLDKSDLILKELGLATK
ncbi:MAG: OmpH family outer membrane protein [Arachidicoccus sp.]|nr:OmpH family outer membrane protein [Arachidicoccus sp.]